MSEISNKINEINGKLDLALDRLDNMLAKPNAIETGDVIAYEEYGTVGKKLPSVGLDYFCVTAFEDGQQFSIDRENSSGYDLDLWYSYDCNNWNKITWAGKYGTKINLNNGQSCWIKGDNDKFSTNGNTFRCNIDRTLVKVNYSGNIMSLVDSSCKSLTIPSEYCFYNFFYFNTQSKFKGLKLPAMNLKAHCYEKLFAHSGVEEFPELPATTLAPYCYARMLSGSYYRVTQLPELPATTLAEGCYAEMFLMYEEKGGIMKAMKTLPAATPAKYCYRYMFRTWNNPNQSSAQFYPPEVMLENNNAESCMNHMFVNCKFASPLKVHLTSWSSASNASTDWLAGVNGETAIICPSELDTTTAKDNSHVPSGWTVYNGSNDSDNETTATTEVSNAETYLLMAGKEVSVISVSNDLTLSAYTPSATYVSYAEVVLDIASNATVTAGSNLTLVDTPEAGMRNICVCRWSGGACKLYVTIVEDLPQA